MNPTTAEREEGKAYSDGPVENLLLPAGCLTEDCIFAVRMEEVGQHTFYDIRCIFPKADSGIRVAGLSCAPRHR